MSNVATTSAAALKPLDPGLSVEVLDWVVELREIWLTAGLSINLFAATHPYDKGTVSRYLSGQRVPGGAWFLNDLLAIMADQGRPVTQAVRDHLSELHLRALQAAHPHEYRVRQVRDALEIALTGKLEAERYARGLEEQLAERNREIQELTADKKRLRTTWDDDYERLTDEIQDITRKLNLAQERGAKAERRCQHLEYLLDQLAWSPAEDETSLAARAPLTDPNEVARYLDTFAGLGLQDQVLRLADRAVIAFADRKDRDGLLHLAKQMRCLGALDQADALIRQAFVQGALDITDLELDSLMRCLKTFPAEEARDAIRKFAADAYWYAAGRGRVKQEAIASILQEAGENGAAERVLSLQRDVTDWPWLLKAEADRAREAKM